MDAKTVTGRVQPPATITYVDCESGPAGSHQPWSTFSGGQMPDSDPQFTDGPRHAGDEVVLRSERPDLAARYWQGVLWSLSYFAASAGGAPLEAVKRYVENQRVGQPANTTAAQSPSTSSP